MGLQLVENNYNTNIQDLHVNLSRQLSTARYDLSISEKMLLYCALARMDQKKQLKLGWFYPVTVRDFAEMRGITLKDARHIIETAEKSLFDKTLQIKIGEDVFKTRWITASTFRKEEDTFYIQWAQGIEQYITELKNYFSISTSVLQKIKSKHTQRILELIRDHTHHRQSEGYIGFTIDEFLSMIEAPDYYKEYKYLKKEVLLLAIKELFDKELYYCVLREYKVGRQVKSFKIFFRTFNSDKEWAALKALSPADRPYSFHWVRYPEANPEAVKAITTSKFKGKGK